MATKDLTPEVLSRRRVEAVRLRLDGYTIAKVSQQTGLSAPTVSAAWKAFCDGGWDAVPLKPRGRKAGQAHKLDEAAQHLLLRSLAEKPGNGEPAWSSRHLAGVLAEAQHSASVRAIEHWLAARDLKPDLPTLEEQAGQRGKKGRWYRQQALPLADKVRQMGGVVWQGGARVAKPSSNSIELPRYQLYLQGKRSTLFIRCLKAPPMASDYMALFQGLMDWSPGKPVALIFHGAYFQASPDIGVWLADHHDFNLISVPPL